MAKRKGKALGSTETCPPNRSPEPRPATYTTRSIQIRERDLKSEPTSLVLDGVGVWVSNYMIFPSTDPNDVSIS